jgi:hypothetical protein
MKCKFKKEEKTEKSDLDKIKDIILNKKVININHFHGPNAEGIKLTLSCGSTIEFFSSAIDYRGGNLFGYKIETREDMLKKLENDIHEKKECLNKLEKEYISIKSLEK